MRIALRITKMRKYSVIFLNFGFWSGKTWKIAKISTFTDLAQNWYLGVSWVAEFDFELGFVKFYFFTLQTGSRLDIRV